MAKSHWSCTYRMSGCSMSLGVLATVCAAGTAASQAAVAPTLTWHLDETGAGITATDSSGNGYMGTVGAGVTGGAAGVSGTAYSGFAGTTTTGSGRGVSYTFGSGAWTSKNFTLTLWARDPGTSAAEYLAGGGSDGGNQAWQLWIDGSGTAKTLKFSAQDWNAKVASVSFDINWLPNEWHQIAVVFTAAKSSAYDATVTIYDTVAGSTAVSLLQSGTLDLTGGTPTTSMQNKFFVGANSGGDWNQLETGFPGGHFSGAIDEVNLWMGSTLTADELSATLTQVPEPASLGVLSLAGWMLLRRKDRK